MPKSIFPIVEKQDYINLHISAGFKLRCKIKKRSDSIKPFEKFWYGIFHK